MSICFQNGFCAFLNLVSSARASSGSHSRLERIGHDLELSDDLVQRLGAMHNIVARAGVDRVGGSLLLAHNKDVVVPSVTCHTTVITPIGRQTPASLLAHMSKKEHWH